jgi:hypothetical protein
MENHPPARKVVTRAPWRTVRRVNLPRLFPEPIECESSFEWDFAHRAALCTSVTNIRHQPARIELANGRTYTPDFLVEHRNGPDCVIEVKPFEHVAEYVETFDGAARALREQGRTFLVLTERELQRDAAHERASFILRYRKSPIAAGEQRIIEVLEGIPSKSLDIRSLLDLAAVDLVCVLVLLASRRLRASSLHHIDERASVALVDNTDTRAPPSRSSPRGCAVPTPR